MQPFGVALTPTLLLLLLATCAVGQDAGANSTRRSKPQQYPSYDGTKHNPDQPNWGCVYLMCVVACLAAAADAALLQMVAIVAMCLRMQLTQTAFLDHWHICLQCRRTHTPYIRKQVPETAYSTGGAGGGGETLAVSCAE